MRYNEFWPGGPRFIEDGGFKIGTDSIMLYAFSQCISAKTVCDLGCGSGVIGQLLAYDNDKISVCGVEIQRESAEAAIHNAEINGMSDRVTVINGDLREHRSLLPAGGFDLAVMNPPYFPAGSGKSAKDDSMAAARDERLCSLDDACAAAAFIVRYGGRFCMVHKPERAAQVIYTMHHYGLEPKRLRTVQHRVGSAPNLVLIEAIRGAKPGLTIQPPLILTDESGGYTVEVKQIYHRL